MKFSKAKHALAVAAASVLPAIAMAADGENQIDVSAATGALTQMKTAVTTWFDAAQPVLISVLGLGLVIVLSLVGWKLFKRVTNKAG